MPVQHQKSSWMPALMLLGLLAAAWLLWSGLYKPLLLGLGIFSCLLVFWLTRRMGYFDHDLFALRFNLRLVGYWWWLGGQIIRSSLAVTRIIFDPKLPISPTVVDIHVESSHPFEQVLLGNSITLTPGTLSMDLHQGVIKVHALTRSGAEDLLAGDMNRRVARVRDR